MQSALRRLGRLCALCALAVLLAIFVPINLVLSLANAGSLKIVGWAADRWHALVAA